MGKGDRNVALSLCLLVASFAKKGEIMSDNTNQNTDSRGAGKFRAAKDLSIKSCKVPVTTTPSAGQGPKAAEDFYSSPASLPTPPVEYDISATKSYRQAARDEAAKR